MSQITVTTSPAKDTTSKPYDCTSLMEELVWYLLANQKMSHMYDVHREELALTNILPLEQEPPTDLFPIGSLTHADYKHMCMVMVCFRLFDMTDADHYAGMRKLVTKKRREMQQELDHWNNHGTAPAPQQQDADAAVVPSGPEPSQSLSFPAL